MSENELFSPNLSNYSNRISSSQILLDSGFGGLKLNIRVIYLSLSWSLFVAIAYLAVLTVEYEISLLNIRLKKSRIS